ncbi:hypothetical protein E5K04_13580 [Crenobacter intestini]|uniref:Uncharacterized protein n=1 Tax=Crenobacter intestini TaxID=2563443 RepID=A0A4T0UM89_9NEIS|nr:hypothetical protein E5K04_13580 [Crenobacter intestini]
MSNGWTPERRAKQAELIRQWQPWAKSTGARTAEGKAASARNSTKHGLYSKAAKAERAELRALLRHMARRLRED